MSIIHDHASVAATGDFSQWAQYTAGDYDREPGDAVRPDSPDRAGNTPSDFGSPIEDWKVD